MTKSRLEAFSDGVIAIVITIMVLELRVPDGADLAALQGVAHEFAFYVLSFVYVGIYWSNHHHMLHATERVNGTVLWANLHLLFWLSLVPFATRWMGVSHIRAVPTAIYGVVMLAAAIAWSLLQTAIVRCNGPQSRLAVAVGRDKKGKTSIAAYAAAIALSALHPLASIGVYVLVAAMWLVPDRRIESQFGD